MKLSFNALVQSWNTLVRNTALTTTFISVQDAQNFANFAKPSSGNEFLIMPQQNTMATITETPIGNYRNGKPSAESIPKAFQFPNFKK